MKLSHAMAAGPVPDLEALVARHVEARGGKAAIETVRTFDSDIRIVEPTFEVDGVRDGSAAGAAALRHGIELPFKIFGLHALRDRGHREVERKLATGDVLATVTVREIRINPPLDPGRFSPP